MAGKNGRAGAGAGPLQLGDLSPHKKPVTLKREGETVTLWGFVNGPSCLGSVKAEVAAARNRWLDAEGDSERIVAYYAFVRDSLLAVLPGLEEAEADLLAGDDDKRRALLVYLEWESEQEAEPDAEGEVAGGESQPTTAPSSPTSPPATESAPVSS